MVRSPLVPLARGRHAARYVTLLCLFVLPAMAQTFRGSILGNITDPTGAAVSGARERAARRLGGVSVRGLSGFELHHRSASGRVECLDRRRRIRTRIQDGAGDG